MEALCATSLPSCSSQAAATVKRNVKAVSKCNIRISSGVRTRLACRSSLYLVGSSDLGSLKLRSQGSRAVLRRGIRCDKMESSNNGKVDVWIGRVAMIGFVVAIGTEIASGKGVLANIGVSTPAPTLALALTAVVGAVVSFGVFRSAAEE